MQLWNRTAAPARPVASAIRQAVSSPTIGVLPILGMSAFAVASLILLAAFNNTLLPQFYYMGHAKRIVLPFAVAAVAAAALYGVRYREFTPLLSATLRASAVGLLVFLLLERPEYTLANPDTAQFAADYVRIGYWFALPLAVISLFRPSFVVPVAIYIISGRHLVQLISGWWMSVLDIRYMIDMALYLAIFGIAVVKAGPRLHPWLGSTNRQNEIVGVAFGLHLANYFWSGVAKVLVGPAPWCWIFDNKTYNQIPHTIESGILPIGHVPWLADIGYKFMQFACVPLNAAIVLVQLFAILCIFRVSWLKVTSVLFDFLHVGIYIFGGLFFWPWIWNNLTIWWGARSAKGGLALNTKVACIVAILLGAPALKLNEAAWLAWFDVADARQVHFEAVTKDGRSVKAPSAFFLSHSYSVSHGAMGAQPIVGQYDGTQLASAETYERNQWSGTCPDPRSLPNQESETPEHRAERTSGIQRFLKAHHQKMLEREAALGLGNYYVRLHHHPSNPFLYGEFNQLSLRDVVGYRLVMESDCHRLVDGRVVKKVWARDTEFYSVQ